MAHGLEKLESISISIAILIPKNPNPNPPLPLTISLQSPKRIKGLSEGKKLQIQSISK